jgi:hypothetical protein
VIPSIGSKNQARRLVSQGMAACDSASSGSCSLLKSILRSKASTTSHLLHARLVADSVLFSMSMNLASATSGSNCQKEAIDNARASYAKLPRGNALFDQCISNHETVHDVLYSLCQQSGAHKRKKSTKVLERFQNCASWMMSISRSIDVAVQTSSGIACPLWAPIKFVLKV